MLNKVKILRKIKDSFQQKSLFLPVQKSFLVTYFGIIQEYIQKNKISPVTADVIKELVDKKILSSKTMRQFRYDFKNFSIHDIYLQNYDGRSYSRGFSKDINEAIAKALGEVFERQFMEFPGKNLSYYSINELEKIGNKYIHPNCYPQPTASQRKEYQESFSYNEETVLGWVKARELVSGEGTYVLAQDAHWGYPYVSKEPKLVVQGTNGCGGGYTYESALQSALLEVYQRDIFFKIWYFKKSPNLIILESVPKDSNAWEMINNLIVDGFSVFALDMTPHDGVPVIVVIIMKENTGWYVGASSSFSKVQSLLRALEEAFSVYMWLQQEIKHGGYNIESFIENEPMKGFLDRRISDKERIFLWGSKYYSKNQDDFLIRGEKVIFEEKLVDANFVLEFLLHMYGKGYVVEGENKILDSYDYFSVKVIFPRAYNLSLVERHSRPVVNGVYPQNISIHPFP